MDVEYPKNWSSLEESKDRLHCIAENTETGVCIGYTNKPNSFAVWLGHSMTDKTYILSDLSTREEAIDSIVEFINESSVVKYIPSTGAVDSR